MIEPTSLKDLAASDLEVKLADHVLTQDPAQTVQAARPFVRNQPSDRQEIVFARAVMGTAQCTGTDVVAQGAKAVEPLLLQHPLGCAPFLRRLLIQPTPASKMAPNMAQPPRLQLEARLRLCQSISAAHSAKPTAADHTHCSTTAGGGVVLAT